MNDKGHDCNECGIPRFVMTMIGGGILPCTVAAKNDEQGTILMGMAALVSALFEARRDQTGRLADAVKQAAEDIRFHEESYRGVIVPPPAQPPDEVIDSMIVRIRDMTALIANHGENFEKLNREWADQTTSQSIAESVLGQLLSAIGGGGDEEEESEDSGGLPQEFVDFLNNLGMDDGLLDDDEG